MRFNWKTARQMQSKKEGICAECDQPIKINTAIFWNGEVFKAAHAACADPMMANPWFVQHLAGEYAFHPAGFTGRAIANQLVRAEFLNGPEIQKLPCPCSRTTWWKATVGSFVCPDCGRVGYPEQTEADYKALEERLFREGPLPKTTEEAYGRAYLAEQRQSATDPIAWAKACQRHADDPFEEGCDGPCCAGGLPEDEAYKARLQEMKIRVRAAAEAGDAKLRRKPLRDFQHVAENHGLVLSRESSVPDAPVVGGETKPVVALADGRYTVVFSGGEYRTVRVRKNTSADFFRGEGQKLSYLSGPDNDTDYTSFGLLKADGTVVIWKKFTPNAAANLRAAMMVLLGDPTAAREAYALRSGRCSRCGRSLTVPASLHRGLGPECANKI